jgi:outer membrane protein assembly factor BamB
MKKHLLFIASAIIGLTTYAQVSDWNNGGGNPSRNGFASVNGPTTDSLLWQATPTGLFGMPICIEGNKLVTMRFLTQTNAPVQCYNLTTGELLWSKDVTNLTGRSLPVGFRDNQVYVMRLTESYHDSLYALNADDGSRIWTANITVDPYITASVSFASNGDLFIESSFKMNRINYQTGQMTWSTNIIPFVQGVCELSVYNNTGYIPEQSGGIAIVSAIDLETGQKKYSHPINDTHPGGGLMQCPLMVGPDGTIFFHKQGDNITALSDNGSGFTVLWETEIFGNSPFSHMCVGSDGSVYAPSDGKIIRLDPVTGQILNNSPTICQNVELFQLRASAAQNGIIYATNGENGVYAFTLDLQELWSDYIPNVNTSGAAIGSDGVIAVSGANIIKVYTPGNTTGIDHRETRPALVCYPNPVRDVVTILTDSKLAGSKYSIIDFTGKTVLKARLSGESTQVNLDFLTSGIYWIRLEMEKKVCFKMLKL